MKALEGILSEIREILKNDEVTEIIARTPKGIIDVSKDPYGGTVAGG